MPIDHYQAVLAGEEYVHGADHAVAKDERKTQANEGDVLFFCNLKAYRLYAEGMEIIS